MRRYLTAVVSLSILALLFAAGCEDSKNPLSNPSQSKPDNQLIGLWRQNHDPDTSYYFVGRLGGKAPQSLMRMVTVTQDNEGNLEDPEQWIVFPTMLDDTTYLNLAPVSQEQIDRVREEGWKSDLINSYIITKYQVKEGALLAWPTDIEAKKKAIQSGKIQGEIKSTDGTERVRFTDTTENTARFVTIAKDSLFSSDALRYERVR